MSMTARHPGMPAVEIVCFGYGHGDPPPAEVTFDLRRHFRDPHVDPALRYLTATNPRVMAAVLGTPGIRQLVAAIVDTVRAYASAPARAPVVIAVGCVGGRHRSAAVAIEAGRLLNESGIAVAVTQRDMMLPVIRRSAAV